MLYNYLIIYTGDEHIRYIDYFIEHLSKSIQIVLVAARTGPFFGGGDYYVYCV